MIRASANQPNRSVLDSSRPPATQQVHAARPVLARDHSEATAFEAHGDASRVRKRTRGRIGYLLRMYPRVTQTFVVNEILELERQGVDIRIFSLREPNEDVRHDSVTHVKASVDCLPRHLSKRSRHRAKEQAQLLREALRSCRPAPASRLAGARQRDAAAMLQEIGADFSELVEAAYVLRWARRNGIDHLHVHFGTSEATVALLAQRLGGLSYSLTLHAFDIFRDNVDRALLARKINASRFTVTVSEYNRRFLLEHITPGGCGSGAEPEKIRVNYNGIDLARFSRGNHHRDATAKEREALSILSVGRLIEKKGFVHLIRAVKRLRSEGLPVTCRIAGDGREGDRLRREIERLGLTGHVELLGAVRQDQVLDLMRRAGCFALPCVQAKDGNIDALPTVLLETLACGCPSVSTRLSGVPEIIDDEVSGLLVPPEDDAALAHAIGRILREPALAARLADGGRRRAEQRFDLRRNVATMHHWLENGE